MFGLFWKEKIPSFNRRNTIPSLVRTCAILLFKNAQNTAILLTKYEALSLQLFSAKKKKKSAHSTLCLHEDFTNPWLTIFGLAEPLPCRFRKVNRATLIRQRMCTGWFATQILSRHFSNMYCLPDRIFFQL